MANFLSFLLTLVFMVVYGLVGGAILMLLERNTEKEFKEASNETIHNIIANNTCFEEKDLLEFQKIAIKMSDRALLMREDSSVFYRNKFDIRSSIMVASCYFSGIGLRNMNPITTGGRIFSIIYLLFTSYYLFFITYLSAEIFRRFMMAIFPKLAERRYKKKFLLLRLFILIVIASIAFIFIPAAVIQSIEPWTYLESMYFCFVYLITLGFSDYMPGDLVIPRSENFVLWYRLLVGFWVLLASLWIGVILIFYSFTIGYYFWQTTNMAVDDKLEDIAEEGKRQSRFQAAKYYIKKKKEAWRRRRQERSASYPPSRPPPQTIHAPNEEISYAVPYNADYIQAVSAPRFEGRLNNDAPVISKGRSNVIQVTNTPLPFSTSSYNHLPDITYPSFSKSSRNSLQSY